MRKDRPTILQIVPQLDAGGAELSAVEMAQAIVSSGGRAIVLTEPGGRLSPRITAAGGEVIPFPAATKNPLRMLANAMAIRRMVRTEAVALIHARSRAPAWSALWAARAAAVPLVTTYHGAYRETNTLKRHYNSVMARGDVVIANSHYTANIIGERYRTPPERLVIIHRGVDITSFDAAKVAAERVAVLRQRWGIAPGQRIILQAARLTRWKGQATLIEAVARLHRNGALGRAILVLAGDPQGRDGYVDQLHDQIRQHGLQGKVVVPGHVEDMPAAYLAAHVTVIASIEPEAFGRTAIEAAAFGCPVIATNIGAPPETVLSQPVVAQAETTGWLVPPSDPDALAAKLAAALTLSPADRALMGDRARRHVLANFTTAAMQGRTLAVYDRLLGTSLQNRFKTANSHSLDGTETAPHP